MHRTSIPPCRIEVECCISFGRGLGSSGAAVVASVLFADTFGSLQLNDEQMLSYALMIEQNPENSKVGQIFTPRIFTTTITQPPRPLQLQAQGIDIG